MTGIVGKKLGMTQLFEPGGRVVPVTVIEAAPGCVVEVKTNERDGYEAVKVGFIEERKQKNVTKPMAGVFKKAGTKAYRLLREFKMDGLAVGDFVGADRFEKGDKVSVRGVSKGKGFQGVMKRHNFAGGPAAHGSMFKRAPGSIGQSAFPSRVFKNKKMPGHMGDQAVVVKNLEIVEVRENLIMIRGAVPGARNAVVEISKEN